MKNILLALVLGFVSLVSINSVSAQISYEPITIVKKGIFGKKYYQRCDVDMDGQQLTLLFAKDPQMEKYSKKIGLNYLAATLLKSIGSVLVLWPVTQEIADEDADWYLALIGAGCIVASIPFSKWFDKRALEAIDYYNNGYKTGFRPQFNLDIKPTGFGLSMHF